MKRATTFIIICGLLLLPSLTTGCSGSDSPPADLPDASHDAAPDAAPDADAGPGDDADACIPSCEGRECGSDGCGGQCSPGCEGDLTCNEVTGTCECLRRESNEEFCARREGLCGLQSGLDSCGEPRTVECTCGAGQFCGDQGECVPCALESDDDFCERLGGLCGPLDGLDLCQAPRSALCDRCPGAWSCASPPWRCINGELPQDDICEQASPISAAPLRFFETLSLARTTVGASNDRPIDAPCLGSGGNDLFFRFTLDDVASVQFVVIPTGTTVDPNVDHFTPSLTLLSSCRGNPIGTACSEERSNPKVLNVERFLRYTAPKLEPGTYIVAIDSPAREIASPVGPIRTIPGPFVMEVTALPALENDLCMAAAQLHLTPEEPTTLISTTLGADNSLSAPCGNLTGAPQGGDLFFQLHLPEGSTNQSVTIEVEGLGLHQTMVPVLHAYESCEGASLGCASFEPLDLTYSFNFSRPLLLHVDNRPPGSSFILVVDSQHDNLDMGLVRSGLFRLTATVRDSHPPENGHCEAAQELVPGGAPACASTPSDLAWDEPWCAFELAVDTRDADDRMQPSCRYGSEGTLSDINNYGRAPELYYTFTTSRTMRFAASVFPDEAGGTTHALRPVLTLLPWEEGAACSLTEAPSSAPCGLLDTHGVPAHLVVNALPPGDYLLVVDGKNGRSGAGTLSVLFGAPLDGTFTCPGEELQIDPETLSAQAISTTELAVANTKLAFPCAPNTSTFGGNTLAWRFTTPADRYLAATIQLSTTEVEEGAPQARWTWNPFGRMEPALALRESCNVAGSPETCQLPGEFGVGGVEETSLLAPMLQPGTTYSVLVDNRRTLHGEIVPGLVRLDLQLSEPTLSNDTCDEAAELKGNGGEPLEQLGTLTVTGDTRLGRANLESTCAGESRQGLDLAYQFTIANEQRVELALTSTALAPILTLSENCAKSNAELGCAANPEHGTQSAPSTATLLLQRLPPGTYFVMVDSHSFASSGPFQLTVTLSSPAAPPENDQCGGALSIHESPLNYDVDQMAPRTYSLTGQSTVGAGFDGGGSCRASETMRYLQNGGELFYVFELMEQRALTLKARTEATIDGLRTPFGLRVNLWRGPESCLNLASAEKVFCKQASWIVPKWNEGMPRPVAGYEPELSSALNLFPGIYYLAVGGLNASAGIFDLELTVEATEPLFNDTCLLPEPIPLVNGYGFVEGNTARGADNIDLAPLGICGSTDANPDLVYSFDLTGYDAPQRARIYLNFHTNLTQAVGGAFYLRKADCDPVEGDSATVGCVQRAARRDAVETVILDPAVYYLWIKGHGAIGKGPFVLKIDLEEAPLASDLCADPGMALDVSSGYAKVFGDTTGQRSAIGRACGSQVPNNSTFETKLTVGPEAIYHFTLSQPTWVWAKATRTVEWSGFDIATYFLASCEQNVAVPDTSGRCANTDSSTTPTIRTAFISPKLLQVGTHHVVVDGGPGTSAHLLAVSPYASSASSGEFELELFAQPEPWSGWNPDCDHAKVITLTDAAPLAKLEGSTLGMGNQNPTLLLSNNPAPGEDALYAIVLAGTAPRDLAITLKTPEKITSALALRRGNCTTNNPADELGSKESSNQVARLGARGLSPGTYYLWVDAMNRTHGGAYTLEVRSSEPFADLNPTGVPPVTTLPGMSCAEPLDLDSLFDASGHARTIAIASRGASRSALAPVQDASCNASKVGTDFQGPEVIYAFTARANQSLSIVLDRDPLIDSTAKPSFHIRKVCDAATHAQANQPLCKTASTIAANTLSEATTAPQALAAGERYYLVIDSTTSAGGAFTLDAFWHAPPNDTCGKVEALAIEPSAAPTLVTYEHAGTTLAGPICGSTSGALVYRFDTPATSTDLQLELAALSPFLGELVVGLQQSTECGTTDGVAGMTLRCFKGDTNTPIAQRIRNLAPNKSYFLYLLSPLPAGQKSLAKLKVTQVAPEAPTPPSNERCDVARDLGTIDSSLALLDQRLDGAAHDITFIPNAYLLTTGPDLAYKFHLERASRAWIRLVPRGASFFGGFTVRSSCASATDEMMAGMTGTSLLGSANIASALKPLDAGDHYLWVGSDAQWNGSPFDLFIEVAPLAPYDSCASPLPLERGIPSFIDLSATRNHFAKPTGCTNVGSGFNTAQFGADPDAVLTFTPTELAQHTVTVDGVELTASADYVIWLAKGATCATATCENGVLPNTANTNNYASASLTFTPTPADLANHTPYFIFVALRTNTKVPLPAKWAYVTVR